MAQLNPLGSIVGPDAVPAARRPRGARTGVDQVRPGDVLLSLGDGPVSWAIAAIDGGGVSHAALALGDGQLGEVTCDGPRTGPIDADEHDRMVARRLAAPADPTPVTDVARRYLDAGGAYAHQQIVLLAVLCATRRAPVPGSGRRLLRAVLDQAAGVLNTMAEHGRTLMICSEFVHRCHREADPARPYALDIGSAQPDDGSPLDWARQHPALPITPPTGRATTPTDLGPLVAEYAAEAGLDLPTAAVPPFGRTTRDAVRDDELLGSLVGFGSALAKATGGAAPHQPDDCLEAVRAYAADPNFVTPGDLARTTSLTDRVRLDRVST